MQDSLTEKPAVVGARLCSRGNVDFLKSRKKPFIAVPVFEIPELSSFKASIKIPHQSESN
jgi:hypothetical protein